MSRIAIIKDELTQTHTVEDLTEAFEGIASMHIGRIRDRVVASKDFFSLLWPVYRSLRVNPRERLLRPHRTKAGKNVFLVVTSEGKLASEIVETIVATMIAAYSDPKHTDIMVVGRRGLELLHQHGVPVVKTFQMPVSDERFNVGLLVHELDSYEQISVFYQTYESLRSQRVARIELVSAVRQLGEGVGEEGETLSEKDYIFEPGIAEIADYMESVMMGVALLQVIMESKLAGHASRFNAMNRAKHRAHELVDDFRLQYYRAKRAASDERTKEIMKVVRVYERRRTD